MDKIIDGLKIKSINEYLNKKKIMFNTYSDLIDNTIPSVTEISIKERKSLLATYLIMFALKNDKEIMDNINYTNFSEYSRDLSEILNPSLSTNKYDTKKMQEEQILNKISEEIISEYLLKDENKEKIIQQMYFEDEEESIFLSYLKLKPILLSKMKEYNYIEDIQYIIDIIIIEYKKIESLEFIAREEIERYEIFYEDSGIDIKEILYKI